eukprot:CAMPEP_0118935680 /NCGR_PEP_ID=MMETSP1169-20130426/15774_1 /TAXON_ID=36882 /ORGANISM="Pyramimonas obovata, Strain CCMP722" /LENGTH=98 /DNA_ID=CAMNT_0006878739 /DNA_START=259 /DNA_END=559 /DNA_ORIENTATION=+
MRASECVLMLESSDEVDDSWLENNSIPDIVTNIIALIMPFEPFERCPSSSCSSAPTNLSLNTGVVASVLLSESTCRLLYFVCARSQARDAQLTTPLNS